MSGALWSAEESRKVRERVVIEGRLVLQTPLHLGSGDDEGITMPLLRDARTGRPLLPGASLAGALRAYLQDPQAFGGEKGDAVGIQSDVVVDDSVADDDNPIAIRDGVRIEPRTRTAANEALYRTEVWQAGTTFPLRIELIIREGQDAQRAKGELAVALTALQRGAITLGKRKTRGYGRVKVSEWVVRHYDFSQLEHLLAWLGAGSPKEQKTDNLFGTLGGKPADFAKPAFELVARFKLKTSLLIRTSDDATEMAHLTTGDNKPVLPGTSVAGALRARCQRILNTLRPNDQGSNEVFMNTLFGGEDMRPERGLRASKVIVAEHPIEGGTMNWVQNRVSIDRFTGGALETALFDQRPLFGSDQDGVCVELRIIRDPKDSEIGLILLALKDLWTGDLALGGEQSVGRGVLQGHSATLSYGEQKWTLQANNGKLSVNGDQAVLEGYVRALVDELEAKR
ncbi:RAMP superfamily CRISPR-associated protein [Aggregatilineales bacterium SYSU G02658]